MEGMVSFDAVATMARIYEIAAILSERKGLP